MSSRKYEHVSDITVIQGKVLHVRFKDIYTPNICIHTPEKRDTEDSSGVFDEASKSNSHPSTTESDEFHSIHTDLHFVMV